MLERNEVQNTPFLKKAAQRQSLNKFSLFLPQNGHYEIRSSKYGSIDRLNYNPTDL